MQSPLGFCKLSQRSTVAYLYWNHMKKLYTDTFVANIFENTEQLVNYNFRVTVSMPKQRWRLLILIIKMVNIHNCVGGN